MTTTTATTTAPMGVYDPELIDPSPYQARVHFLGIEELWGNIELHGLIQPLVARRSPVTPGRLELITGERRLRAVKFGKLLAVDVIVRDVSDNEAAELVLTENLQREDLTPMEEADSYFRLKGLRDAVTGQAMYTNEVISDRLKKPLSRVRMMLALRDCPAVLREAVGLAEGGVSVSVAGLVGRIPDGKAREVCAGMVLKPKHQDAPLNFSQTRELIRDQFMVRVGKGCGFDVKDATLLPAEVDDDGVRMAGGACEDCPWRSGNRADLADEMTKIGGRSKGVSGGRSEGVDPWVCTMPGCYKRKQEVVWRVTKRQAEEQNLTVIEGDAARRLFDFKGELNYDAKWVLLDGKPEMRDFGDAASQMPTWRKLIAGLKAVELAVAQVPETNRIVYLCKRATAVELVRRGLEGRRTDEVVESEVDGTETEGEAVATVETQGGGSSAAPMVKMAVAPLEAPDKKAEKAAARLQVVIGHEGLNLLLGAVEKQGVGLEQMPMLAEMVLKGLGSDGLVMVGKWLEVKLPKGQSGGWAYQKPILEHMTERAGGKGGWEAFVFVALVAGAMKFAGAKSEEFQAALEAYGIKRAEVEKRAKALVKGRKVAGLEEESEGVSGPVGDPGELLDEEDPAYAESTPNLRELAKGVALPPVEVLRTAERVPLGDFLSFEDCIERVRAGASYVEVYGPRPPEGTPERKVWEAKKVKLWKAVKKGAA